MGVIAARDAPRMPGIQYAAALVAGCCALGSQSDRRDSFVGDELSDVVPTLCAIAHLEPGPIATGFSC